MAPDRNHATRRTVLASLAASLVVRSAGAADRPALRALAGARGVLYGSAIAADQLGAGDGFAELVRRECAALVTENDLKWSFICAAPQQYDFSRADAIFAFAEAAGLAMRGHTLLWFHRTPDWFKELTDRVAAERAVLAHITTLVGRYRGRVRIWDVVNEPVELTDGRSDGLRWPVFLEKLGPGYIDLAFHAARAADPGALLLLNEYGVEYDTPDQDAKRDAVLRLLERLRRAGTPLDLLGVQAHLEVGRMPFSAAKLKRFLGEVAALGLGIAVTELDVVDAAAPGDRAVRDGMVADEYARFLDAALAEPAVRTIMTWGLSDRHSWIVRRESSASSRRQDGLDPRPLPFDTDLRPKAAWHGIAGSFRRAIERG